MPRTAGSGTVKSVIERGLSAFLGIIERHGPELRVRAADRRLAIVCNIPRSGLHGVEPGDWVIADIKRYPLEGMPGEAWVRKKLDPERPVEMATEAAIARFDLPARIFPPGALQEAKRFGSHVDPAEAAERTDLRQVPLVTIDGEDARDFDDAVYAELDGEDFRLLVAIADVSHYVRTGTRWTPKRAHAEPRCTFRRACCRCCRPRCQIICARWSRNVDRLCMVADMSITGRGCFAAGAFTRR